MFPGLDELPQLNKNLETLQEAIELMSKQLSQLHTDLEGLSGEVRALKEEMGRK